MVNFQINWSALIGIALALGGSGLYFLRSFRPSLARDHDIFFAAVGLLCGGILLFHGWRQDPILQFGQFLLAVTAGFFAFESIRLRGATTEQAKRSSPIVDDDRPVSRVYRAELDDLDAIEERQTYPRRIRGSEDPRESDPDDYSAYAYGDEPRRRAPRNGVGRSPRSDRGSVEDLPRRRSRSTPPPSDSRRDRSDDFSEGRSSSRARSPVDSPGRGGRTRDTVVPPDDGRSGRSSRRSSPPQHDGESLPPRQRPATSASGSRRTNRDNDVAVSRSYAEWDDRDDGKRRSPSAPSRLDSREAYSRDDYRRGNYGAPPVRNDDAPARESYVDYQPVVPNREEPAVDSPDSDDYFTDESKIPPRGHVESPDRVDFEDRTGFEGGSELRDEVPDPPITSNRGVQRELDNDDQFDDELDREDRDLGDRRSDRFNLYAQEDRFE